MGHSQTGLTSTASQTLSVGFGVFERLPDQTDTLVAPIFADPDELDENFAAISVKSASQTSRTGLFYWQYHNLFLNGLQGLLQFDEEILKRIGSARRIVGKNQWIYVVLRRMTLVFFLLTTLFTLPSSFMPMISLGAAGSDWLASLPNIVGESVPPVYWTVLVVLVWLLMLVLNGVIKSVYDSSVVQTTSNLSSDLQAYTQQLYLKGFKSAMDNINDEEASYGNDSDTSVWPERAKKWSRVAHWHGKRIEWLARYTSIEVWIMQRSLRLVDNFSRFVTFLFLLGFVLAARPQDLSGDMAAWSMVAIGAVSIMAFLGWDQLGKESTDPLGGSLLGPDRQRWFQSVDIAGEFANQVFKDKARIQRKVRTREGGGE